MKTVWLHHRFFFKKHLFILTAIYELVHWCIQITDAYRLRKQAYLVFAHKLIGFYFF